MKISEIFTYFTDTIFRRDINEWRNPVIRWLVQQYRLLFYTARGLLEHGTIVRSAALTFYTLMSLVPIVAVVFAVVKGFGLADGLIDNLYALFPQNPEIIDYVVGFAEKALARTQGGVVAAVALVMLFWAIIRVFGSIESAFNNIWEVKVERSVTRQYTDYIAVVMIVPVLWVVANAVGNYTQQLLGLDGSWYSTALALRVDVHHLGDVHHPVYHHPQHQSQIQERADGGHRRRHALPALSVGLYLHSAVDDLL